MFFLKKRIRIFHLIFMGVNPFDSVALGRLIERVVDSGFVVQKKKIETSFLCHIDKNGGTASQNHQNALGKNVPRLLIASIK